MTIECVASGPFSLTESPVWDSDTGTLYWCDIPACAVHALVPQTGARREWGFPGPTGSMGLCRSGRLVVATGLEVVLFDADSGETTPVATLEAAAGSRANDGKVGPDGAFWVGTMVERQDPDDPQGALFRVGADGSVEKRLDGLRTTNGLAWSADGMTMYHADSRGQWIDRWDFDPASGNMKNRTRIAEPTEAQGRPDGGATDIDGNYWSAGVSAGALNCWSPQGELLSRIEVPVPRPTMPCFGGPDLKTLYFTSIRANLDAAALAAAPDSGGVFAMPAPVAGAPVSRFDD
ncbi:SMP-30/gluconolactonase/LRE family protein [Rhodobacteraceae bacterium 2CG4]|uniref:SMP-30/gluconolactonase/LRE family protein n=1 Tax=Halovulum marinum TaxID=2662447 RepID=A0A6L5Z1Z9_9RHOB|nr:SMP-30/gluconolactonase/LRE family protein [Halovulum marinum]MSU90072.1 SMP-30/gluconolactonase/LRE family protein [Halovulum marinum]